MPAVLSGLGYLGCEKEGGEGFGVSGWGGGRGA